MLVRTEHYEYDVVENLAMITDCKRHVTAFQYAAPNHIMVRTCVIADQWLSIRLQTSRGT